MGNNQKDRVFNIKWKEMCKSLTIYMTLAILVPVFIMVIIDFFSNGEEGTNITLLEALGFITGVPIFCALVSLLIAQLARMSKVAIKEGYLHGRNYWGFKKAIPLKSIQSLDKFDNNGIEGVFANAGKEGKVFIYNQTEDLSVLMNIIRREMKKNRKS